MLAIQGQAPHGVKSLNDTNHSILFNRLDPPTRDSTLLAECLGTQSTSGFELEEVAATGQAYSVCNEILRSRLITQSRPSARSVTLATVTFHQKLRCLGVASMSASATSPACRVSSLGIVGSVHHHRGTTRKKAQGATALVE